MADVKSKTYVTILPFMRNELELKGNELLVYAIIHGFSMDGESKYIGSRNFIAEWCGISVRQVQTILNSLVDKELIKKEERELNGVRFCNYATNFTSGEKTSLGGGEETSHHIYRNRNIYKEISSNEDIKKVTKKRYGKYNNVLLTDDQRVKLENELGNKVAEDCIQLLDNYCESSGKSYKNYYQTIHNWVIDKYEKENVKLNRQEKREFLHTDIKPNYEQENDDVDTSNLDRFMKERENK